MLKKDNLSYIELKQSKIEEKKLISLKTLKKNQIDRGWLKIREHRSLLQLSNSHCNIKKSIKKG